MGGPLGSINAPPGPLHYHPGRNAASDAVSGWIVVWCVKCRLGLSVVQMSSALSMKQTTGCIGTNSIGREKLGVSDVYLYPFV